MSESLDAENISDAANSEPMPKLGELLSEKREEKGLSIEDVSNRLRLSVRQVKALEGNDFDAFPEAMMMRGFLRNYARFLEMDPEPLMEAYRVYVPSDAPYRISIESSNVLLPSHEQRSWVKYLLAALLLALLVGAWMFYSDFQSHKEIKKTAEVVSEASTEAELPANAEPMPEPALPLAERAQSPSEEPTQSSAPAIGSSSSNTAIPPQAIPDAQSVSPQADTQKQAAVATPQKSTAVTPALKVKFILTEQSWISVIDRDGREIFNKTKAAGSADEVEGQPPLRVVVGNAAGTQVIYKDKPIDLAPYSRLNVAKLTLSLE